MFDARNSPSCFNRRPNQRTMGADSLTNTKNKKLSIWEWISRVIIPWCTSTARKHYFHITMSPRDTQKEKLHAIKKTTQTPNIICGGGWLPTHLMITTAILPWIHVSHIIYMPQLCRLPKSRQPLETPKLLKHRQCHLWRTWGNVDKDLSYTSSNIMYSHLKMR